ncbi:MAG TPA: hypothetical protein VMV10_23300 [Pirellulales bacterium]|nr:hypothetical protein [Pirellulales bacterium]
MSLASSPTRRQREIVGVARLLASGLTPAETIRRSGLPRGLAAAYVRRLRHLRIRPFLLRHIASLGPDEQFRAAVLHLIVARRWEQRARQKWAARQAKGGAA